MQNLDVSIAELEKANTVYRNSTTVFRDISSDMSYLMTTSSAEVERAGANMEVMASNVRASYVACVSLF